MDGNDDGHRMNADWMGIGMGMEMEVGMGIG